MDVVHNEERSIFFRVRFTQALNMNTSNQFRWPSLYCRGFLFDLTFLLLLDPSIQTDFILFRFDFVRSFVKIGYP